jgi:hypothetical protein
MRIPWSTALAVALLFLPLQPSAANGQERPWDGGAWTVVHPTGDPTQDVPAVRTAIQAGGTVLLKATDDAGQPQAFDFGDFPVGAIDWNDSGSGWVALGTSGEIVPLNLGSFTVYVSLGNDVRLLGETARGAMTTVRGGTIPIRNFAARMVPGSGIHVVYGLASLAVEGVRFTGSALQAIYTTQLGSFPEVRALARARGLDLSIEIRRNEFLDVQPAYAFAWYALAAVTDGPAGAVRVEDNLVRFTPGRWDAAERGYELANGLPRTGEIWEGFSIADLHAPAVMARNGIRGVDLGLLVYFEGSDVVRIVENRVELRPEGLFGISGQANHRYVVEGNTVIAPGANPDGILLWANDQTAGINGSSVRHNHVVLDGSEYGGITLFGKGASNHFGQNRVEGSAAYALGLVADFFDAQAPATNNAFVGNKLTHFVPRDSAVYGTGAHVFLDAHTRSNTVLGKSGIVKDLGQDNFVAGSRRNQP